MANRLSWERSPYLRQHAHDPVDWFPWGDEPFEKARREAKPVFLSIGYSTCHWCHVMARESFQDPETARFLNRHFVSIKVDREERPDVDMFYMSVAQALMGGGGWPLSVFTTPDRLPFFAGSYFPKVPMGGMPAFLHILKEIAQRWENQRGRLEQASRGIVALEEEPKTPAETLDLAGARERAVKVLKQLFDRQNGGFGYAPKFPSPIQLLFLMEELQEGRGDIGAMITATLDAMANGGIWDQIGGGFHRYCVDAEWQIPHFEKTLYDQAMLLAAYSRGYELFGRQDYREMAARIVQYLSESLHLPEGGFAAGEDADSEGGEGRFYVWRPSQLTEVLGREKGELAASIFGIRPKGNFEGEWSVPKRALTAKQVAARLGCDVESARELVEEMRAALAEARSRRPRPSRDEKVIAAWNGFTVAALVRAGGALGPSGGDQALSLARSAMDFILDHLMEEGRLHRRWIHGEAAHPGFLDDYGGVVWGLLELYSATGEERWLEQALPLARMVVDEFRDQEAEGFFYTPTWLDDLPIRPKEEFDGPAPSGASLAVFTLSLLADITGEKEFRDHAMSGLRRALTVSKEAPLSQLFALWGARSAGI